MRLSRRAVLLGGLGVAVAGAGGGLVEHDVLPGRSRVYAVLGLTGEPGEVPDVAPGRRREGTFRSSYVEVEPSWWVSYPPGVRPGAALPVVVALHGAGYDARTWGDNLGLERFLAASGHRFALAAVDGGRSSFWHRRADGQDASAMVREEFLPLLDDLGLDVSSPGLLGWSMGGLGALVLGARLESSPVLAVSPALWPELDQAMPTAFDGPEQFDEVMATVDRALPLEVRVDCGTADPFYRDVRSVLDDSGADVEQHYSAGAHDPAYWTRVLPGQLDWLATRLL